MTAGLLDVTILSDGMIELYQIEIEGSFYCVELQYDLWEIGGPPSYTLEYVRLVKPKEVEMGEGYTRTILQAIRSGKTTEHKS